MIRFIQSRNMGTFYFPQVIEFKELQDQKVWPLMINDI